MYLRKLTLFNFKNYSEASLMFSEKINCFTGRNGVGKTNLLDAIHYLSFTKSYFNLIDNQNIRHGEEFFAIHGQFERNGSGSSEVSCIQRRNQKKQFRINSKDYERMADHIGEFPLVMVSPYDRDLINEGSDLRRKYIDSVISQFDRNYLEDLITYNKCLAQRNALLKDFAEKRYFDKTALEIWDEQMLGPAARISARRRVFLEGFLPVFRKYFDFISIGRDEVDIIYHSDLISADLREILNTNQQRDLAARFTTAGVHKDDLEFTIGGYPVKKFGSQGQQKSFVLAVKLAQFDYTQSTKGYKPILLLDDIFDKLDGERVSQLINLVGDNSFGQVFITDTQPERVNKIFESVNIDHRIFEVNEGKVDLI
ncbi:MAG: DNA replication and repair protein RecF [Bacteroidetes bacterium HGW-Bacteroidetes-11]|jgi:DNA replication and repair protein RecF|nr:MAG: DNA replication and repair protein RecF [Bacteroidetes bacterium HGW-Bacteroidetes-11]